MEEPPSPLQVGRYGLQAPLVVPSSDARWTTSPTSPRRAHKRNRENHTELTDKIQLTLPLGRRRCQ
jgi:hypothetical protein